jgi:hypothetical protein
MSDLARVLRCLEANDYISAVKATCDIRQQCARSFWLEPMQQVAFAAYEMKMYNDAEMWARFCMREVHCDAAVFALMGEIEYARGRHEVAREWFRMAQRKKSLDFFAMRIDQISQELSRIERQVTYAPTQFKDVLVLWGPHCPDLQARLLHAGITTWHGPIEIVADAWIPQIEVRNERVNVSSSAEALGRAWTFSRAMRRAVELANASAAQRVYLINTQKHYAQNALFYMRQVSTNAVISWCSCKQQLNLEGLGGAVFEAVKAQDVRDIDALTFPSPLAATIADLPSVVGWSRTHELGGFFSEISTPCKVDAVSFHLPRLIGAAQNRVSDVNAAELLSD